MCGGDGFFFFDGHCVSFDGSCLWVCRIDFYGSCDAAKGDDDVVFGEVVEDFAEEFDIKSESEFFAFVGYGRSFFGAVILFGVFGAEYDLVG